MSWGYVAVGAATLVSGYMSSEAQKEAAEEASEAQAGAARAGISEERYQFDRMQELLQPYTEAGVGALEQQQAIAGTLGPEAQKKAIEDIEKSPIFQTMTRQGEEAMLQSAAATGGLRGGDVQGALAQFRPAMLQQLIESQYGKLGGLTQLGQASAAGEVAAGQQTSSQIADLLAQAGGAQAGEAIAKGEAQAGFYGDISQAVGTGISGYLNRPQSTSEGGSF